MASAVFNSVATDGAGNVYAAGGLTAPGSFDFGDHVTASAVFAGYSAVLVKYDSSGKAQSAQTLTASSNGASFQSIAFDSSGNLYAAGYVSGASGPVDFGNGITVTKSAAYDDALLVKYNSSGTAEWARTVPSLQIGAGTAGSSNSNFSSLVVDPSGYVYVVGSIDGTGAYDFGNQVTAAGTATSDDPMNVLLVKYDLSGVAQWARTVTAGAQSAFASVSLDSTGNVYAGGYIGGNGTYAFGDGVTAAGPAAGGPGGTLGANLALVKYDSSGTAQWARSVAAGDFSGFNGVATDSAGNVYAVGSIGEGTSDFGNGVTATGTEKNGDFTGTAGSVFVVLAKYDSSGAPQWARTVSPGGSNSYLDAVTVDSLGNAYVAGALHSTGTYDFGNGIAVPTGAKDPGYSIGLVKYDSFGTARWAASGVTSGANEDIFSALTFDSTGALYAVGTIAETGTVDFGDHVTAAGTRLDGYGWSPLLVKYQ